MAGTNLIVNTKGAFMPGMVMSKVIPDHIKVA